MTPQHRTTKCVARPDQSVDRDDYEVRETRFDAKALYYFPGPLLPPVQGNLRRADFLVRYLVSHFRQVHIVMVSCDDPLIDATGTSYVGTLGATSSYLRRQSRPNVVRLAESIQRWARLLLLGTQPPFGAAVSAGPGIAQQLREVVRIEKPDVSVLFHTTSSGLASSCRPESAVVVDTIDICRDRHAAYLKRTGVRGPLAPILLGWREREALYRSEVTALRSVDAIIAISDLDRRKMTSAGLKPSSIFQVGACLSEETVAVDLASKKEIDILLVGSRFAGTESGLRFLFEEVLPRTRRVRRVAVVGSVGSLVSEGSVSVPVNIRVDAPGIVEQLRPWYAAARIVVNPVLTGSGTSVKGMEALAYGSCSIMTREGARFGPVKDGQECLLRDDPAEFAAAIDQLLADDGRRQRIGRYALDFYTKHFGIDCANRVLDEMFARVLSGLDRGARA